MNRQFYWYETMFRSLRDELRNFLKSQNIYYELSEAGEYYHFEIKANAEELKRVNEFLDSVTIICQSA